jgi:hypothetical protein
VLTTLNKIIELTRDIFGVEPVLQDGGSIDSGTLEICVAVDVGPDADANEVARQEAEWNDCVAALSAPDVFLRVDYGIPDLSGLLPENSIRSVGFIVVIIRPPEGRAGRWLADFDNEPCVVSERSLATVFSTRETAQHAVDTYLDQHEETRSWAFLVCPAVPDS